MQVDHGKSRAGRSGKFDRSFALPCRKGKETTHAPTQVGQVGGNSTAPPSGTPPQSSMPMGDWLVYGQPWGGRSVDDPEMWAGNTLRLLRHGNYITYYLYGSPLSPAAVTGGLFPALGPPGIPLHAYPGRSRGPDAFFPPFVEIQGSNKMAAALLRRRPALESIGGNLFRLVPVRSGALGGRCPGRFHIWFASLAHVQRAWPQALVEREAAMITEGRSCISA